MTSTPAAAHYTKDINNGGMSHGRRPVLSDRADEMKSRKKNLMERQVGWRVTQAEVGSRLINGSVKDEGRDCGNKLMGKRWKMGFYDSGGRKRKKEGRMGGWMDGRTKLCGGVLSTPFSSAVWLHSMTFYSHLLEHFLGPESF